MAAVLDDIYTQKDEQNIVRVLRTRRAQIDTIVLTHDAVCSDDSIFGRDDDVSHAFIIIASIK